jgi:Flp pilus assembly pilin Flp
MGLLSGLFDFLKSLFEGIINFLKEYGLYIILILVAIYIVNPTLWSTISTWLSSVGGTIWSYISAGASALGGWLNGFQLTELLTGLAAVWFITDPEGVVTFIADTVSEFVEAVAGGISSGLGLPTLAAVGLGLWFLTKSKDKKEESDAVTSN